MPEPIRSETPNFRPRRGRCFVGCGAVVAIVVATAFARAVAGASGYDLEQCYRLALERSKTVAAQVESIRQAKERIAQTRAAFRPSLSLGATVLRQQSPGSALAQNLFPSNQETVRASASQNLFKGFRDLATLRSRGLARRAAEFARDQAEVQLFLDVTQAFYEALARESDLDNYREEIAANEDRRRELLQFKRSARARDADIATVEAAIATLEATRAGTRGSRDAARETLAFLTGLAPDAALVDAQAWPAALPGLDTWLERRDDRPDVRQAQSNLLAADENVDAARAGGRASVDLSANYYFERPGISEDSKWDVQLNVTQPIFTGGLVAAQVREAMSQRRANEVALAQAREAAERDIRSLYRTLQANLDQAARLERAVALTQRNYDLLRKDNRAGLATNIDVLQALATLYQTRRAAQAARYTVKSGYARLRAIAAWPTGGAPGNSDLAPAPGMPR